MKIATGPNFSTTKLRKTTITSLISLQPWLMALSLPRCSLFMHRPQETARKTTASTLVLTEKVEPMLLGMMLRMTLSGLEPVEPLEAAMPSITVLKVPAL